MNEPQCRMNDRHTRYAGKVPFGIHPVVWRGACALAVTRHPNAIYPQPSDVEYASVVMATLCAPCPEGVCQGPPCQRQAP